MMIFFAGLPAGWRDVRGNKSHLEAGGDRWLHPSPHHLQGYRVLYEGCHQVRDTGTYVVHLATYTTLLHHPEIYTV
jgi:hypothetical protein